MHTNKVPEQHIAVFGESGSGKTILLSSFYGSTQEATPAQKARFQVVADNPGQANKLYNIYLGMRDSRAVPETTRFKAVTYPFTLRRKKARIGASQQHTNQDLLRVLWHDYPGEWFEQDTDGEEAERKAINFDNLIRSDVALVLVDAQRLLDNAGEEELYLKSLLANLRNGLSSRKKDLLTAGKPLARFPRIWILALSKSDLMPEMNVTRFRDLLISKACDEIEEFRLLLTEFIVSDDALSVGEDFVLLSSAKFTPEKIKVSERIGLELILPIASMLPLERYTHWADAKLLPGKVAESILGSAGSLVDALADVKIGGKIGMAIRAIAPGMRAVLDVAHDTVRQINNASSKKTSVLVDTLSHFAKELETGEASGVLHRSPR